MRELPELVRAMSRPEVYPVMPAKVQLLQTQMSFIFLAGDYVYKIKKPVNLGYLDYTTLDTRKILCNKEVELNRRLCPSIYLGVVPVTKAQGKISLNGPGEIIEYAVKMRNLPQNKMMNVLLGKDRVTADMVQKVAAKLADFHSRAQTGRTIDNFGSPDSIKTNTDENFTQTEKYFNRTISPEKFSTIKKYTDSFLNNNFPLFEERIKDQRIRDCHGDLHAAHICFTDGICIYDCIEFNDRFRYCDVASEIAFLAMDLDHYGRADLSCAFTEAYIDQSRDNSLLRLLNFYKCYRAYVRGKVESFKLDDPYITEEEKRRIVDVASGYFDLAEAYTWKKPKLVITVGLVGTGKSAIAHVLAQRLGLTLISSDVTRKKLAGISPEEHRFENFSDGIYSPEFNLKTYNALYTQARDILAKGGSAVIDAAFLKHEERVRAREIAAETGGEFYVIECTLPESVARERLEKRLELSSVSDGRWEIYLPQKLKFEPVNEVPDTKHIVIDTSSPVDIYIHSIIEKVTRSS